MAFDAKYHTETDGDISRLYLTTEVTTFQIDKGYELVHDGSETAGPHTGQRGDEYWSHGFQAWKPCVDGEAYGPGWPVRRKKETRNKATMNCTICKSPVPKVEGRN